MEVNQIKERLKASLEVTCKRNNLILHAVGLPIAAAVASLGGRGRGSVALWPFVIAVVLLVVIPIVILDLWQIFRIFRKPEAYVFSRFKLTTPHPGNFQYSAYYTVLVDNGEGRMIPVDTHAIFSTRHGHPSIEEYTNKTVTIAYNRETEMVVVIG